MQLHAGKTGEKFRGILPTSPCYRSAFGKVSQAILSGRLALFLRFILLRSPIHVFLSEVNSGKISASTEGSSRKTRQLGVLVAAELLNGQFHCRVNFPYGVIWQSLSLICSVCWSRSDVPKSLTNHGHNRRLSNEGGSIVSTPAVADDTLFITNGGDAVALDQFSGREHWRFAALDRFGIHLTSTPTIENGVGFVTGDGWVFALDGITGRKIWRQQLQAPAFGISSAAVANGVVYVGGQEGALRAQRFRRSLSLAKHFGVGGAHPGCCRRQGLRQFRRPELRFVGLRCATGGFLWSRQRPGEPVTTVTVANGVVYDIVESGTLQMFDVAHGTFPGSIRDPDGKPFVNAFGSQPIVANGTVYVSARDRVDAFHLSP